MHISVVSSQKRIVYQRVRSETRDGGTRWCRTVDHRAAHSLVRFVIRTAAAGVINRVVSARVSLGSARRVRAAAQRYRPGNDNIARDTPVAIVCALRPNNADKLWVLIVSGLVLLLPFDLLGFIDTSALVNRTVVFTCLVSVALVRRAGCLLGFRVPVNMPLTLAL